VFRSEKISCRLAIQLCIGYFPDGRERHRTFSVKNISPDAEPGALRAFVAAIGKVLAYPVTKARLIIKTVRTVFDARWPKSLWPEAFLDQDLDQDQDQPPENSEFTLAHLDKIEYNRAVSSQQSAVSSQQSAVSSQQSAVSKII
jgi:hypothetical protein